MSSKKKFGVGLIVGAIAGLVAGLLTAPKSGKDTRADLKRKAKDVKHETDKHLEAARQRASDMAGQAKKTVDHVKEVTDSAVEGLRGGFAKGREDAEPHKKNS